MWKSCALCLNLSGRRYPEPEGDLPPRTGISVGAGQLPPNYRSRVIIYEIDLHDFELDRLYVTEVNTGLNQPSTPSGYQQAESI